MDYLQRACRLLGENAADVMSYRVYADRIALVVDRGIKGGPKFTVLLTDLPEPLPEPDVPQPNATDAARALAADRGLDLRSIAGTGAGERVLVRDVRAVMGGE